MFVLVVFWQGFKERSDIFWGSNLGHKEQGVVRSVFHVLRARFLRCCCFERVGWPCGFVGGKDDSGDIVGVFSIFAGTHWDALC